MKAANDIPGTYPALLSNSDETNIRKEQKPNSKKIIK